MQTGQGRRQLNKSYSPPKSTLAIVSKQLMKRYEELQRRENDADEIIIQLQLWRDLR